MIHTDIGAYIQPEFALIPVTLLSSALASTAATEVNGPAYDRFSNTSRMMSAQCCVPVEAVLTSGVDASIAANLQHADTTVSTDFADFGLATSSLSWTGATGGTTVQTVLHWDVNLTMAKRYVRMQVTPTLGTTGLGSSVKYGGLITFGGADRLVAA